MRKIIITIFILFIISNTYSKNEVLNELIEKLDKNQNNMFIISYDQKKLIESDKLYLIPEIIKAWVLITINNIEIKITNSDNPLPTSIIDYKIYKKDNKYTIDGILFFNSKKTEYKKKHEFIFDKNFLTIIMKERNSHTSENISLYYIDINNDFEKKYKNQRISYFYRLTKDSKDNELIITKDNKLKYNDELYDFRIEPIIRTEDREYYKDKFVFVLLYLDGDVYYKIPIEIINNSIKIMEDKKLVDYDTFYEFE